MLDKHYKGYLRQCQLTRFYITHLEADAQLVTEKVFPLKEELSCLILDKSFHQPGQVQVGFTQAVKQLVLAINFFFVCV